MKRQIKWLVLVVLVVIIGLVCFRFVGNNSKKVLEVKETDSIEGYNYKLYDNDSKLYKEYFGELKKVLKDSNVDEEKYVELISKLFIIDFFTLDNKVTNDDIGGVEFVHKDALDNFKLKAKETFYKYLESNVYGDRNQELPTVNKIDNVKVKTIPVNYKDIKDEKAYEINISFDYEKDLDYAKEKTLIFVHEDKKLSLIQMK